MSSTSIPSEKIKLEFSNIKENFTNEINDPLKKRIVFSGAFGSGKTTFLRDYFANNSNYLPIHIFPVNYAVSSNEDIFELIKFDILYKLLDHKPDFEKLSVTHFQTLAFLSSDDLIKILTPFIKSIDLIDQTIFGVFESLKILKKTLQDKKNEVDKSQAKAIEIFFKTFELEKGSIYEHDFYTELLNTLITNIEANSGKKLVLIIDDLDRIDPEHIFRILNVFAAHFDIETDQNKFGLSKVILACDFNNVKKIFEHRYGKGVDFKGYVNKFYSAGIFEFDNRAIIRNQIQRILSTVKSKNKLSYFDLNQQSTKYIGLGVRSFLQLLVENNRIQIRDLLKLSNGEIEIPIHNINLGRKIENIQIRLSVIIEYLKFFLGSEENLLTALSDIRITPYDIFRQRRNENQKTIPLDFLGDIILVNESKYHKFREGSHVFDYNIGNVKTTTNYTITEIHFEEVIYFRSEINLDKSNQINTSLNEFDYVDLMPIIIDAFENYFASRVE